MTSPCTRVESTSSTTSRFARRCRPDRSTATSTPSVDAAKASRARSSAGIDPGHLELHGCDGIAGDAHDAVDVAAVVGDASGDAGHRGWSERMTEDGDMAPSLGPRGVDAVAGHDVDLHAQR